MRFRIPQAFIYEFSERLLGEADVVDDIIEANLTNLIYEAGERNWDTDDDDEYYYVEWDD